MRLITNTIWKSHKRTLLAIAFVFLYSASVSLATPPTSKYQPGQTLNPDCAPGESNCSVQILPEQTGNADKYLTSDGNVTSWTAVLTGVSLVSPSFSSIQNGGTVTVPSGTATLATTANITSSVNVAVSGTSNYIPKFTGTNTIGNSNIYDDGTNVGIGDATPSSRLEVNGDIRMTAGSGAQLIFADGSTMSSAGAGSAASVAANADAIVTGDSDANNSGDVILKTASNDRLHILNNGNVGIGDATPASLFTVGNGDLFQINSSGAVVAGAWNGSVVAGQYGGTGVANTGKTITVSGNTTIGSSTNTVAFLTGGNTSVTLPTTGTLATLAGSETLTNKTLTTPVINGTITGTTVIPVANGGTGSATQNFVDLSNAQTVAGGKTFTGIIAPAASSSLSMRTNNQTTGHSYWEVINTSGDIRMGVESSTGGSMFTGTSAYATVIGSLVSKPLEFAPGGTVVFKMSETGVFNIVTAPSTSAGTFDILTRNTGTGVVEKVSTLPIANGGTGSATQNFVDLSNTQTIGGQKTFTGYVYANAAGPAIRAAGQTTGSQYFDISTSSAHVLMGAESSTGGSIVTGSIANSAVVGTLNNKPLQLFTNNAIRMTIEGGGNVGIGTASPEFKLTINTAATYNVDGSGAFAITNSGNTNQRLFMGYDSALGTNGSAFIQSEQKSTAYTPLLLQPNGGNVGIGTTSPGIKLEVVPVGASQVTALKLRSDSSGAVVNYETSLDFGWYSTAYYGGRISGYVESNTGNGAGGLKFYTASAGISLNSTPSMTMTSNGNVGIGTTSPAAKLDVNGSMRVLGQTAPASGAGVEIDYVGGIGRMLVYDRTGTSYLPATIQGSTVTLTAGATGQGLFVNTSGNVGVGTASPGSKLTVSGNTELGNGVDSPIVRITASTSTAVRLFFNGTGITPDYTGIIAHSGATDNLQFLTNNTTALTLGANQAATFASTVGATGFNSSSGWMNFNTGEGFQIGRDGSSGGFYVYNMTDSRYDLKISEAGGAATFASNVTAPAFVTTSGYTMGTSSNYWTLIKNDGNYGLLVGGTGINSTYYDNNTHTFRSYNGAATYATITSGGLNLVSLGTGAVYSNAGLLTNTNPSDRRLKNNIHDLSYGLEQILQLQPKSYYYNDDEQHERLQYGFVAQDVQSVMPELVRPLNDGTDHLGLEINGIYVAAVNAIKEMDLNVTDIGDLDRENSWRDSMINWFANATNGIGDFVVERLRAKSEICIDDVCMTKDQLRGILQEHDGSQDDGDTGGEEEVVPSGEEAPDDGGDTPPADEEIIPPAEEPETPPEETPEPPADEGVTP